MLLFKKNVDFIMWKLTELIGGELLILRKSPNHNFSSTTIVTFFIKVLFDFEILETNDQSWKKSV